MSEARRCDCTVARPGCDFLAPIRPDTVLPIKILCDVLNPTQRYSRGAFCRGLPQRDICIFSLGPAVSAQRYLESGHRWGRDCYSATASGLAQPQPSLPSDGIRIFGKMIKNLTYFLQNSPPPMRLNLPETSSHDHLDLLKRPNIAPPWPYSSQQSLHPGPMMGSSIATSDMQYAALCP